MSLEGSWDFEVKHGGAVYKCRVRDERIDIEAPSGLAMDAKWDADRKELVDWCGTEGDIPDEEIPQDVLTEAEEYMRAVAEAVDE